MEYEEESLKQYIKDINQYPLLNHKEEICLAKKVAEGDIEAYKKLIESNLRLVISIAKNYKCKDLNLLDLIQEGNIGLMNAALKFDYKKGYRFSTYAVYGIKQKISRAIIEKNGNIRVPADFYYLLKKFKNTNEELENLLNRKPTTQEIAEKMQISVIKVQELEKFKLEILSLNSLFTYEDDLMVLEEEVGAIISDEVMTPEEEYLLREEKNIVRNVIVENTRLNNVEKLVLLLRFGFINDKQMKLSEIGKIIGMTSKKIQRVYEEAFHKLLISKNAILLDKYLHNNRTR